MEWGTFELLVEAALPEDGFDEEDEGLEVWELLGPLEDELRGDFSQMAGSH